MTLKEFKRIMGCVDVDHINIVGKNASGLKFEIRIEKEEVDISVDFFFKYRDDTCNDFEVRSFDLFSNNERTWMCIWLKDEVVESE